MPIFHHKTLGRVLFIHIPRTGGASIEQWIRNSGYELTKVDYSNPLDNQHATRETYERWGSFDYKFTVVRHPLSRLISALGFRAIPTTQANAHARSILRKIRIDRVPGDWQPHLIPQVDFIDNDVEVFRFEDKTHLEQIKDKLAFTSECPHENHSKSQIGSNDLSPELRAQVREIYSPDYEAFSYE